MRVASPVRRASSAMSPNLRSKPYASIPMTLIPRSQSHSVDSRVIPGCSKYSSAGATPISSV